VDCGIRKGWNALENEHYEYLFFDTVEPTIDGVKIDRASCDFNTSNIMDASTQHLTFAQINGSRVMEFNQRLNSLHALAIVPLMELLSSSSATSNKKEIANDRVLTHEQKVECSNFK